MATANKLTVEQRLSRANFHIMRHSSFCAFSGLLFVGNTYVVEKDGGEHKIDTAAITKSGNRYFNRAFMEAMDEEEFNFVVIHEVMHLALLHVLDVHGWSKLYPMHYNLAIDHVVNNMILEVDPQGAFAKMPVRNGVQIAVCDVKYKGWSTQAVLRDILQNSKQQGGGDGKGDSKAGKGSSGGGKFDDHKFDVVDGEGDGQMTDDEVREMRSKIEDALRQGAQMASKNGGNAPRGIDELLTPKVRWEDLMEQFVREVCVGNDMATWRRPNRRFLHDDMLLPSMHTETVGAIVFGIDTSGSIGGRELTAAVTELVSLCHKVRPSKIILMYWDAKVQSVEEYLPHQFDNIASSTKPKGGGGTCVLDMAKKVKELKEEVVCCVQVTDGYLSGDFGVWDMPTLWCITSDIVSPVGKTIKLEVSHV